MDPRPLPADRSEASTPNDSLRTGPYVPAADAAPPDAPAHAGRCRLLEEVGRGGMGAVLRAFDPDLGRDLAVKVLREEFRGRPEMERRFLEEARLTGRLQHPGVVPVVEAGRLADGRPFFTMKLVQGRTLAELLKGRLDPSEDLPRLLAIFEQVCQTAAFAHARGVIHRDLKPSNVMVGAFGEVQVMDWGLARSLTGSREAEGHAGAMPGGAAAEGTQAGAVLGTPAYLAPEQARGEADAADARADVFGLGAVLCEVLTGRPPFAGGPADEALRRAARGDLSDAFARLDGCGADAALVQLAKACLDPDPGRRPSDAGAVAAAVTAYLAGVQERLRLTELERAAAQAREAEATATAAAEQRARAAAQAREEEAKAKAAAERRARRVTVGLAASVVLTAALLGGGGGWLWWRQAETTLAVEADLGAAMGAAERGDDHAAREALERAQGRLAGGGFDALRQRVEALRGELDFVAELDEARMKALETTKESIDDYDMAGSDAAYTKAFADRSLDVTGPGAADALQSIGRSP
jgi:serine/threonine-protein kinase